MSKHYQLARIVGNSATSNKRSERPLKGKVIRVQRNKHGEYHDVETMPHPKTYKKEQLQFL